MFAHVHGGARHHRRQRLAAAHRRQPLRDHRRVDVGADLVPRRQRHHPAADRLAGQHLRPQAPADGVGDRLHDLVAAVRPRAEPAAADRSSACCRGRPAARCSRCRRRCCSRPSRRTSAARRWASGASASSSRRSSGPCSAAGSPTPTAGAGSSTSTCRSASSSLVMTQALHLRPALPAAGAQAASTTGASACSPVGIGALQLALDKGQEDDWFSSPLIVTLVVLSAGGAGRVPRPRADAPTNPVVDLRVFKLRTYSTGVFLMTTLGFVLYGSLVLLPIMLQTLLGYPSLQAGIAMAPRGMGSFIGMPIVGLLIGRVDPRTHARVRPDRRRRHAVLARRSSICRPATGTSSGRSSCRASACRCSSCRSPRSAWTRSRASAWATPRACST